MIARTAAITFAIAALSLVTLPATAQTGAGSSDSAQSESSSSDSSSDTDELDQLINDMATEALQCVAVMDVAIAEAPDHAAEYRKVRDRAAEDFNLYTDESAEDYLPDLIQSYKDQVASGDVKKDEWIDSCLYDFTDTEGATT